jgi:hypothetical protein
MVKRMQSTHDIIHLEAREPTFGRVTWCNQGAASRDQLFQQAKLDGDPSTAAPVDTVDGAK